MDSSFFDERLLAYVLLAVGIGWFFWSLRSISREPGDRSSKGAQYFVLIGFMVLAIVRGGMRYQDSQRRIKSTKMKTEQRKKESEEFREELKKHSRSYHASATYREPEEESREGGRAVPAGQPPGASDAAPVAPTPAPTPVRYRYSLARALQVKTAYGVMTYPAQTLITPVAAAGANMRVKIGTQEALIPQTEIVSTAY